MKLKWIHYDVPKKREDSGEFICVFGFNLSGGEKLDI